MHKILIPTDFSPVADNALDYAIEIGAKFSSELYLYHVYTIHKVDYNLDYSDEDQPHRKELERKMKRTKQKFIDKITEKGLSVQTIVEMDNILSIFERKARKHAIDLIVMGSKGASGLDKVIFGSVAATALKMANVPVLVVPPQHPFQTLKQIVLAADANEISTSVLLPLQKLAAEFGARVTILNVNTNSSKSTHEKIAFSLQGVETTYLEVPLSNSVNETINAFIEKNGCDLLCMVRREKGFFEGLFQKSFTTDQVYNLKNPLLVLPE